MNDAKTGNGSETPKIRILLIDDKPEGLWNEGEPSLPLHPALPEELRKSFELRWIATAGEAREYIDLMRMIGRHNPAILNLAGTVPEIVVIDYSLTQAPHTVEQRLREKAPGLWKELSPLEPLRRIAENIGLPLLHEEEQYEVDLKGGGPTAAGANIEGENYGCFVGGLIISALSDHPCAPVTVTVRQPEQLRGTHTGFFQWLMRTESSGKLQASGRTGITWKQIIDQGAALLRRRIEELARVRAISLSFLEMVELAGDGKISTVTVESRYGIRNLPLAGLFYDKAPQKTRAAAKEWAIGKEGLLEQLAARDHFRELTAALELSETVWQEYMRTDDVRKRLRLAMLFRQRKDQSACDLAELNTLWTRFSTTPFLVDSQTDSLDKGVDIRIGKYSDMSRRWACLMILVRLLKFRVDAIAVLKESDDFKDDNAWIVGLISAPLQADDLYLALFPIARNPIDLKNKNDLEASLKRWNPPLRVNDLLPGVSDAKNKMGTGRASNSVSSNDRQIMEWYALSLGFVQKQWDKPTRHAIQGNDDLSVEAVTGKHEQKSSS